jgi:hypothetical protein
VGLAFILAYAYPDSAMFAVYAGSEEKLAGTPHEHEFPF